MATNLATYLGFDGTCEEAFKFYEQLLGGRILMMMHHSDAPPGSGVPQGPEVANRVMHARLEVGSQVLMGGDAPMQGASKPQGFCVNIGVDTADEADRLFAGLAQGGAVTMPIMETFWAHRFGMVTDRFGTPWMINCEKPMG